MDTSLLFPRSVTVATCECGTRMREDLRTSEAPENVLKNEAAFINILHVVLFLLGSIFPHSSLLWAFFFRKHSLL